MIQTATGDTEVQFNMLAPVRKDFHFVATPVDGGPAVEGAVVATIRDPKAQLLEKVIKVRFNGLKPDTEYKLTINELRKEHKNFQEERRFRTTSKKPGKLKMLLASCMNDENRYAQAAQIVWKRNLDEDPDVVLLLGDVTYVDSFDYVDREEVDELKIWQRYFRAFDKNPYFRLKYLIPTYTTWDDHDTGINNGNSESPNLKEAQRALLALYGADSIPGFVEKTSEGVQTLVQMRGQNIVMFDSRSFRLPHTKDARYAHFGQGQEEWFFERLKSMRGPIHLVKGDMWAMPTVLGEARGNDAPKRVTESFFGDHPTNYRSFMEKLFRFKKAFALYSGDIHFSEVSLYGPEAQDSFRAPFQFVEVTSSPVSSILFGPRNPGEPEFWANPARLVAARDYNAVMVESEILGSNEFQLRITARGSKKAEPLFRHEQKIKCESALL